MFPGVGASSDTITVITGNNNPVIAIGANLFAKTDAIENTDFTVTDDAGDAVTVTLTEKPSFVTLQNLGGSNYRIVTTAKVDHIGWFTLKLKATDNKGGESMKNIMLTVADKNTRSVFIKFGPAGKSAPAPWNNWLGFRGAGNTLANLRDERNIVTPFSITTVSQWVGITDLGHISRK